MNTSLVNRWLAPLAAAVGVPLQLDADGVVGMELDNGLVCTIELDAQAEILYFHSVLMVVPPAQAGEVFLRAMEANLYGLGTGGATLGWHAQRRHLVASQSLPLAALSEESFLMLLQAFVASITQLRAQFH